MSALRIKKLDLFNSRLGTCKLLAVVLLLLTLTLLIPVRASGDGTDHRAPDVPANLVVPGGNRVEFHAFGVGVQIYVWNETRMIWVFKAPEATLFDADGNVVGTHFGGPTWESDSGSRVVGQRIAGAMVDPTAIPWLLLKATSTAPPGIFARTTFIQRVNTAGGLAPSAMGTSAGQVARVPYTAEYWFFRAQN